VLWPLLPALADEAMNRQQSWMTQSDDGHQQRWPDGTLSDETRAPLETALEAQTPLGIAMIPSVFFVPDIAILRRVECPRCVRR
jgi:hypothetical protein